MANHASQETSVSEVVVYAPYKDEMTLLCRYQCVNGLIPRVGDTLQLYQLQKAITSYKNNLPSSGVVTVVTITPKDIKEVPYVGFVASATTIQIVIQPKV